MIGRWSVRAAGVIVLAVAAVGCGSAGPARRAGSVRFGDLDRGRSAIEQYGCGSCHTIPGVRNATALVGPPLNHFGSRSFIAGQLANTPENLMRWLRDPQSVEPGTAMPNLGVTERDAQDIVAYLESL